MASLTTSRAPISGTACTWDRQARPAIARVSSKELDQLAAQGIMNLRVLAISEASALKRAVTPAVLQQPGAHRRNAVAGPRFPARRDGQARHEGRAVSQQLLAVVRRHVELRQLVHRQGRRRSRCHRRLEHLHRHFGVVLSRCESAGSVSLRHQATDHAQELRERPGLQATIRRSCPGSSRTSRAPASMANAHRTSMRS